MGICLDAFVLVAEYTLTSMTLKLTTLGRGIKKKKNVGTSHFTVKICIILSLEYTTS